VYDAAQALRNTPAGAAAQVIDADPALLAYFAGLTTDQQLSEAASQTLPLLVGATPQVIFNALGNTNRIIQDRPSANSGMNSGDEMLMDTHAWAKVFGSLHDQDDRNQVVGYDGHSKGLVFGFDGDLNDRTTLGVGFAYGNTNVTGNTNLNSAEIDSYQMVGYGSYAINDRTEVNFQADVGLSKTDGERIMVIPVAGQANSDYDSVSVHVGTGIAKSFDLGPRTQIAPTARIDYTRVDSDSYTETGSAAVTPFLNQVSSETAEALEVGLGAKLSHQVGDKTRLDAELGVAYDTMNEAATITSSFVGGGASFTTTGIKPDPWIKRLGLGITSTLNNGAEITASYDIDSRQDFTDQSVSVKFRMMF
jgi:outer membrane autotransporter protein